jgi:hypothetical protein
MAGSVQASDLIVGAVADGRLLPRAQVRQGEPGVAMIELSSGETLAGTTGVFQLTRAGTADPALTLPLELRPREQDKSVVIAEALLDWSSLAGGTYTASAVFSRAGAPFARVSRIVEVVPGVATASGPLARSVGVPSGRNASTPRDAELGDALELVGRYVSDYGQQASLIIGVERYEQRYDNAPLGQPSGRRLTSEFALVKTAGVGWAGFRDVIELNGKPIPDRQDRLQTLFKASTPDVSEARRIADESARFNIGPTRRNFNEPTAALFFLTPATQVRFAFTRKGQTSLDGTAVWEIDFEEKTKPTLIRTTDGRDIASHGTIWVAKSDGTVVRTKMVITGFAGAGSSSTIDVLYARDARLGLWLPAKMTERHTGAIRQMSTSRRASSAVIEGVVTATAVYSDFKRFETAAAIK